MKRLIPLLWVISAPAFANDDKNVVESLFDAEHGRTWNRFADRIVALHRQQLARSKVRMEERTGSYGGEMAKGYHFRERSYYDADSGRLLSRMRAGRDQPEALHQGEVYIYDSEGRVLRDYAFIYLPWARGAPVRTFINLHSYSNYLHAYRQFDASGNTLSEACEGTIAGRTIRIEVWEDEIGKAVEDADAYRQCFAGLPATAGRFLNPN